MSTPVGTRRGRDEGGFLAVWFALLAGCVLFLGGISLDLWRVFTERRALAGIADAAAVAGASGLDEAAFRAEEVARLDPRLAEDLAAANIAAQTEGRSLTAASVVADPARIVVVLEGEVDLTLLGALTPGQGPLAIRVRASAEPRRTP